MSARTSAAIASFAVALGVAPACLVPTSGDRFQFDAQAAGPADADGGALVFTNDRGFAVTLSRATLTLGPLYLDSAPSEDALPHSWWRRLTPLAVRAAHAHGDDEGQLVGEVASQVTVELTRGAPVSFASRGTTVDQPVSSLRLGFAPPSTASPTLLVEGRARGADGIDVGFRGALVLDDSWRREAQARGIADPRVVTGLDARMRPTRGGALLLRIDPRALLAGCDFGQLGANPVDPTDPTRRLLAQPTAEAGPDQVMGALFDNLRARTGVYDARWLGPLGRARVRVA